MVETSYCGGPARDRGAFALRLRLIVRLGPVERETELGLNTGTGRAADKPVRIGVASKKERSATKPRTIWEDIALRERGVDRDRRTVAVRGVGGQADGTDRTRESLLISGGCTWFNDRET